MGLWLCWSRGDAERGWGWIPREDNTSYLMIMRSPHDTLVLENCSCVNAENGLVMTIFAHTVVKEDLMWQVEIRQTPTCSVSSHFHSLNPSIFPSNFWPITLAGIISTKSSHTIHPFKNIRIPIIYQIPLGEFLSQFYSCPPYLQTSISAIKPCLLWMPFLSFQLLAQVHRTPNFSYEGGRHNSYDVIFMPSRAF